MYKIVYFEISSRCNARCPWCSTGSSLWKEKKTIDFVDIKKFFSTIDLLYDFNLINRDTVFNLYNWGEPFLHPCFNEIFHGLNEKDIYFNISTNASLPVKLEKRAASHIKQVIISVSGFSQKSYDKIHGFNFNKILSNIDHIAHELKEADFSGEIFVSYHIYQFNIDEIIFARDFCEKRGLKLNPTCAFMADYNTALMYLENKLEQEKMSMASKQLLLFYVEDILKEQSDNYVCPQFSYLVIDQACKVLTCCAVPSYHENYSIGSIFELDRDKIIYEKHHQKVCKKCINIGLSCWMHNPYTPEFVKNLLKKHKKSLFNKVVNYV
jgi:MoaA/NifB/PqqE/SkfB family radical SAM enzyme